MKFDMKKWIALISVFAIATTFTTTSVLARAGASFHNSTHSSSYTSMGSRGSHTYEATQGTRPIEKSVTPAPTASAGTYNSTAMPQSAGFFQSHPFLSGLAGGVAGSLLGHMLFGGMGGGGIFGGILSAVVWMILLGLVFGAIGLILSRRAK